jgi:EAL domain-containing protein (putative c-di-GMP-specific phosphodiesterase class I)
LQQVKALGCSEMQGFLFSPPRRIEDLLQLFRSRPERKVAALAERRSA